MAIYVLFSKLLHKYQQAVERKGFHDSESLSISFLSVIPYNLVIALRSPKSPIENTSGRFKVKIKIISAVHLPIPFIQYQPDR